MIVVLLDKERYDKIENGDGYCPCSIVKNEDTKCMCKEFRESSVEGTCHCGVFRKVVEVIKVYGKPSCGNCEKIKQELNNLNIRYEYVGNEEETMSIAKKLMENGELVEQLLPIIIKDGKQVKHKEIKNL